MRRVKLAVYSILTLFVFAIIAGGVVSLFFDLNGFKPTLAEAAREQTGRELAIDGDITVSLFPRPRATASGVRLLNAGGGSDADAVTVDVVSVQLGWLPLLTGTLDVRQIHVAGVRVLVEEGADGKSSLAFEPAETDTTGETGPLPDIIDVRDVAIVLRDGARDDVYDVAAFTLRPRAGAGTAVSFEVTLTGASVRGEGSVGDLPSLGGATLFPVALTLTGGGARLSIDGTIAGIDTAPALDLAVKGEGASLAGLARVTGADLPATAPFAVQARITGALDRLRVDDVAFQADSAEIRGNAVLDLTGERAMVGAMFTVPRLDRDAFLAPEEETGPRWSRPMPAARC